MIKNKIISISGEPVTGKSSNIKMIKQKLIESGYKEENIHVISAGHKFRDYFNEVLNFIGNCEDDKKLKELYNKGVMKEIIENSHYRSNLTNAMAKLKFMKNAENITIEQANNMPELKEIRALIDTIIDEGIKKKGQEINKEEREDEFWIVDSRLAFKNIPDSFSVRLTCRSDIAGKRLFSDKSRGAEDNNYKNEEDAINQREKRKNGEIERYKRRYNVDLTDEDNYDLIIDTSFSSIDDISDTIIRCLERYQEGKFIPKKWASPKEMLPLQGERTTCEPSGKGLSIDDVIISIRENGYDQDYPIEIVEVDGKKYIINGHHRNFASAHAGKTLIPYEVLAKDDENLPKCYWGGCPAREVTECLTNGKLWGHEGFFDKKGKKFSYEEIYANIYAELDEREKRKQAEHPELY